MSTVHGISLSPFVRKVILALEFKGVAFNVNPVTPMNKPEGFEKISPLGKIPAYEDDQLAIADSSVICEYLDQRHGGDSLYPEDTVARAKARWFEEYADTQLITVSGSIFFERIVKTALMKQEADEEKVAKTIADVLPKVYSYLESQVGDEGFLVGSSLTIADISVGTHLLNTKYAGVDVDAGRWPKLAAYQARLFATELFANRIANDKAQFGM